MSVLDARKELNRLADHDKAKALQHYFKTGQGQYGEGDIFIGVTVPQSRKVAKSFEDLSLKEVEVLLQSRVHEERLVALLILIRKYCRASDDERKEIFNCYLRNAGRINNWDLVDLSAPNILGAHLIEGERRLLYRLARSDSVWQRRMAIVATLYFIKAGDFSDTLKIAQSLLHDNHDLIHKAAGWMIREVGKKDFKAAEAFVASHCKTMPRTMLRYAIERFPESKKRRYMMER